MKKVNLIMVAMMFSMCLNAQNKELQKVSDHACTCLSEVPTSLEDDKKLEAIEECISTSIAMFQVESSLGGLVESALDTISKTEPLQMKDSILIEGDNNIIVDTNKNYEEIEEILLEDCPRMRLLLTSKDAKRENSVSDKKKAKKFYDKGQDFFTMGDFRKAILQYEKAVKKDENFAFAWDMLGYSHRKLNEFEKAIEYYRKSLEIDPNGKMPLGNIPIAYEYLKQYDNAIKAYGDYVQVYPDDPESYYGIGRLYHLKGDYENALDNMMNAYLMYKEINSPYVNDAEQNIALFYNELKEKDQLALFHRIAKKYNIQIEE